MEYLRQGKPVDYEAVKKIFDSFDELDSQWSENENFVFQLTDEDKEKYKEELEQLNETKNLINSLRNDCGAALFYLIGKVEIYKAKYGELKDEYYK